jgi:hypothetical protein
VAQNAFALPESLDFGANRPITNPVRQFVKLIASKHCRQAGTDRFTIPLGGAARPNFLARRLPLSL